MTQLLIEPARRAGCEDLAALDEVLRMAVQRQRSPIDDVLDAGVVDEERYMRELAHDLGMEWLDVIPAPEVPLPLREACGPRIALRHRLLPVEITETNGAKRLKLATFDPFNLVARQAAAGCWIHGMAGRLAAEGGLPATAESIGARVGAAVAAARRQPGE